MTQINPESGLSVAAQRLDALDADLTRAINQTRSRNIGVAVVMILSIIFFCVYLTWGYKKYSTNVDPDLIAGVLQKNFEDRMPDARAQLEANLKQNAPQYVNQAMDQLQDLADQKATQLQDDAQSAMDKAMPQIGDELYQSLKTTLDTAKQSPNNGGDEQKFQATLAALGTVYADETLKLVDQAHNDYASEAASFTEYLERLGKNQDLDERDQMHRDLFRNVLLLIRQRSGMPAGSQLDTSNLASPAK